ncbi:ParB/RepB/Spo0J family partition protein [Sulfitobacter sp. F26204]|uniref:ParB/RepB/Spo0J family partition protein n=1 Tax=Sulfitobacter sp. F26204 TaxID=2996014 RepID=UPI00225E34D3|nr:ParB/RepB/Spo0J family partition protein [Sulfitobacter sp. F26204]MCX7561772.1 ParB/RepB/Spo0J family partition protein [Sulfitobacter sp. F26204]
MAKRRKLEAPSVEDMGRIEEEFRRETPPRAISAPIAQVAAEAAEQFQAGTPEMRRDAAQAAAYRMAAGQGRLIKQIALSEIDAASMQRDRTVIDPEALQELEFSIAEHGLRLPIELYELSGSVPGKRFGLLSGYRRLIAQQNLYKRDNDKAFALIKAIVRDPAEMGGALVAMVEENEIRQDLSHFERGRIAAIAAQQGAFASTEAAVAEMFAAASKAKRSKIRSFALIFEELGDVLHFAEGLREKDGLRLAQALRNGNAARLRDALATGQGDDARSEWALIDKALTMPGVIETDPKRGGRPPKKTPAPGWDGGDTLTTTTGVTLRKATDDKGFVIRLSGKSLSDEMVRSVMKSIQGILENPEAG